jgi:hypothetical protein
MFDCSPFASFNGRPAHSNNQQAMSELLRRASAAVLLALLFFSCRVLLWCRGPRITPRNTHLAPLLLRVGIGAADVVRVKQANMEDETVRKRRNSKSAVQKNRVPAVSECSSPSRAFPHPPHAITGSSCSFADTLPVPMAAANPVRPRTYVRTHQVAVYLTYEEQESLKMRRRLKEKLKTTKSTLHNTMGTDAKAVEARKAQKKILVDHKGRMAKERVQKDVENANRHLLKKILKLHFRDGDPSTGTAELAAVHGGGGKGTAPMLPRQGDQRTSYMRQRYDALTRISQENQRIIGKLLTTKPTVEMELEATTQQKLGGSMMRPGHLGVMRALTGANKGPSNDRSASTEHDAGDDNSDEAQPRRKRPQSAPLLSRSSEHNRTEGRPTTTAGHARITTYERREPVPVRNTYCVCVFPLFL